MTKYDKGSQVRLYGGDIGLRIFAFGTLAIINEATAKTIRVTFLETFPGEQAEFALQQAIPMYEDSAQVEVKNETVHS